ncbi:MAG: hypothetical protein KDB90_17865 [Planctomycetes bacterium]|nr:hypothetical protein [Planctomycetota bacterium]
MNRITVKDLDPETIRLAVRGYFGDGGDRSLRERDRCWALYRGSKGALRDEVAQYFPEWFMRQLRLPICTQNPARKIIGSRFISYRLPPDRTNPKGMDDLEHGLDAAMRSLELSVGALGKDGLLIRWDEERERFIYFVLHKYVTLHLPGDMEPAGVAYPLRNETAKQDRECRWAVWTDQASFYLSPGAARVANNDDGSDVNPYGVLPVLFAEREDEESEPLEDVFNAQGWHNWTMTLAGHAGLLQGLGVPWKNGRPPMPGESEAIGPYNVQYTEDGGFGFASSGVDLEKLPALARSYLDSVAFSHHLRLNWAGDSMATSGEHQRLLEADLTIAVMADNLRWAEFERNRVEVQKIIAQAVGKSIGSEDFSINYRESHLPMSEQERFDLWEKEFSKGLATRADYLQRKDPDLDDEAAAEAVAELDKARQALKDMPEPPAQPTARGGLLAAALASGGQA